MDNAIRFILLIVGNFLMASLAARAFAMYARQQWGPLAGLILAVPVIAGLVWSPHLVAEAFNIVTDSMRTPHGSGGDASTSGTPPQSDRGMQQFDAPWSLVVSAALLLGAFMVLIVSIRRVRIRRARAGRDRAALEARHDAILEAYGEVQMNLLENLDRLALADVTVPHTEALVDALTAARDARAATDYRDLEEYHKAVTALSRAWCTADQFARQVSTSFLPRTAREQVGQARSVVATARAGDRTPRERRLASKRAIGLIETVFPASSRPTD
ncbi:hypothetical protein WKI65_43935 [Streptomyces sp. MS1.AVA.3]|uniref:hypothetical protein n=1 Tax=Streptomyces decoyicus TaxID=249567 RepID=UPI0030C2B682